MRRRSKQILHAVCMTVVTTVLLVVSFVPMCLVADSRYIPPEETEATGPILFDNAGGDGVWIWLLTCVVLAFVVVSADRVLRKVLDLPYSGMEKGEGE